jgi:hypothetical protein
VFGHEGRHGPGTEDEIPDTEQAGDEDERTRHVAHTE